MRKALKEFVHLSVNSFPVIEPIYEFGSLQVPNQEGFADLRPLFPKKKFVGCDMREGPGVDKILNLHNIDLPAELVGTVLCLDTLEHVEYPRKALKEIHRILKPGGMAIISSIMDFPIHDFPYDYWRFTPEAFKSLLNPFASFFVGYAGIEDFPHIIVGIGFKNVTPSIEEFENKYKNWQLKQKPSKIKRIIKLFIPPILINIKKNWLPWQFPNTLYFL